MVTGPKLLRLLACFTFLDWSRAEQRERQSEGFRGDMGEGEPIGQARRGPYEVRPLLANDGGHAREGLEGHLVIKGLFKLLGLGLSRVEKLVPVLARVPVAERIFRVANLRNGKLPSRLLSVGLHAPRLRTPPLPCYT